MNSNNNFQTMPNQIPRLQLTKEEQEYYPQLLSIVDKNNSGQLQGKIVAHFLKKSRLPREVVKKIYEISAQRSYEVISKEEFFICLRLIALAQNNMAWNMNSIICNSPIPPLPKFDLHNRNSLMESQMTTSSSTTSMSSNMNSIIMNNNNFNSGMSNNLMSSPGNINNNICNSNMQLSSNTNTNTNNQSNYTGQVSPSFNVNANQNSQGTNTQNSNFDVLSNTNNTISNLKSGPVSSTIQNAINNINLNNNNNSTQPFSLGDNEIVLKDFDGVNKVGIVQGGKNLLEQFKLMNLDAEKSNRLLTKELNDSMELLRSFIDDIEKTGKIVIGVDKNIQNVKNELIEVNKKINIEKDKIKYHCNL